MAWLNYQRITEGTGISGKFGETMKIPERWQIRVDDPLTSKLEILQGVSGTIGITYGSPHFEVPALRAMEFDLSPVGRDGMRWLLTVQYYVPPAGKLPTVTGIPDDVWEQSGGTTSIPAMTDFAGDAIVNAAGDPLEGLEKEREEKSWTLTRCYANDDELKADVEDAAGKVNQTDWDEGDPKTWKCYYKGAKKVLTSRLNNDDDGGTFSYVESQWEFRYDPTTWKLLPLDIGMMALDGSGARVAILTDDGKPIKQPVGLDTDGTPLPSGTAPLVANDGEGFDIYGQADFQAIFGTPFMVPAGSGSS